MNQKSLFPIEIGLPKTLPRHRQLPVHARPSSRVLEVGAKYCTDLELLSTLIGGAQPIETAEALLAHFQHDLFNLARAPVEEVALVSGVGPQIAARLQAALEVGRRLTLESDEKPVIHSPADAAALVQVEMSLLEQEELRVILLDTRNRVMDVVTVYKGSLNSSQVRVGEVFKTAIRRNAAAIIICHNHPSGSAEASPDDVTVTRAIGLAGKLVDISVLDHLIIGRGKFVSLKERGLGFENNLAQMAEAPDIYTIGERKRKQQTCTCSAYAFPHRIFGGKCSGPDVCTHGIRLPHHPDYDRYEDRCPECEYWERVDYEFDRQHEEGCQVRENSAGDDDLIYAYSRAQALEDGVLVDVTKMAHEAGFKFPTAITADLHARLIPNETEQSQGQSYDGRLWDVLWMASLAARKSKADRI